MIYCFLVIKKEFSVFVRRFLAVIFNQTLEQISHESIVNGEARNYENVTQLWTNYSNYNVCREDDEEQDNCQFMKKGFNEKSNVRALFF